jgi:ABC-type phosphate transport system ATPase subunit
MDLWKAGWKCFLKRLETRGMNLSGGEQQLRHCENMGNPRQLLLDEPSEGSHQYRKNPRDLMRVKRT